MRSLSNYLLISSPFEVLPRSFSFLLVEFVETAPPPRRSLFVPILIQVRGLFELQVVSPLLLLQMLSELSDDFADYVIEQFGRAFVDETFADHFGLFDVFSSGILVDVLAK